jgi:hypothetical protein
MSRKTTVNSPSKDIGVKWWQQALRSFITPYGKATEAPDPSQVFKRLQPFTCEWLTRPEYALSEFAETITNNLPVLENNADDVLRDSFVNPLVAHFTPLTDNLKALDNKTTTTTTATRKDASKVVKSLVTDTAIDEKMEKMFQVSGAMFAMSANYIISTSLLRHPKQFAGIIDGKRPSAASFKSSPTPAAMKDYILSSYDQTQGASESLTRAASATVAKAFEDSSSSSDDEETAPPPRTPKKRPAQPPPQPEETKSKKKKSKKSRKDKS